MPSVSVSSIVTDGWGCQHVNQDTNWDVPGSPEPMAGGNIIKSDPTQSVAAAGAAAVPSTWKPNINNGTELWEANLRNGGQPPAPAVQKPWGHTPSTNLGGTWGEDDDGTDSGYVYKANVPVYFKIKDKICFRKLSFQLESELNKKTNDIS